MKKLISYIIRTVPRPVLQRLSPPALAVLGWWYRGNTYTCPISGKSYRRFLPYGRLDPRPNALCPDSLSLERHRLLWLYLKAKTNFFETKLHFLHIAPEQCFLKPFQKQHGEGYITADLVSPLAKVKMDVHAIPFADETFDALMCNHVLEHVANDKMALHELFRVLKPGGWAILQVPFIDPVPELTQEDPSMQSPKDRLKYYGQEDHVRKYGWDYPRRLREAGFEVLEDDFVRTLSSDEIQRYALPADEIIYFCTKPA
jgi:SAM-dependent methyltransferase